MAGKDRSAATDTARVTAHSIAQPNEPGELIHADRRHPYYVGSDVTEMGMPEMLFEGEVLPAEQYVVPEDRIILVHPAHEALVVRHGGTIHHPEPIGEST